MLLLLKPSLVLVTLLILAVTSLSAQPAADQAPSQFDETAERQLVQLINQSRAEAGLPALAVDQRLTQAARKHTVLMIQHKDLEHQYAGEPALPLRVANENVRSDKQAENIALEIDAAGAHAALMHSAGHRANIMNPDYNAVGVGVINTGQEIYVTEDFARRQPDYSQHQADAVLQHAIEQYAIEHKVRPPVRRPAAKLHDAACNMALNDSLNTDTQLGLPGVHGLLEWTANELEELPPNAKEQLAQPQAGYSFGVCYAPSVSHPGGVYWVVMVFY